MIQISKAFAMVNVAIAVKQYGLEGSEDAIKRVYTLHPTIEKLMLNTLYEMYEFGKE